MKNKKMTEKSHFVSHKDVILHKFDELFHASYDSIFVTLCFNFFLKLLLTWLLSAFLRLKFDTQTVIF